MSDIEDFVNDIAGEVTEKILEFLEVQDRKYQKRARMGVVLSEDWNGYRALIGGHRIHIEHDSSWHRWRFKDEDYTEFLELSEKKGEAVLQFLRELAKVLSPRSRAATEENIATVRYDETIAQDRTAEGAAAEEIFEEAVQDAGTA